MDTRYLDQGYSAALLDEEHGAYLTIKRNGVVVGEVAVGMFAGGPGSKVQIIVKRFKPNELREVEIVDDFDS